MAILMGVIEKDVAGDLVCIISAQVRVIRRELLVGITRRSWKTHDT